MIAKSIKKMVINIFFTFSMLLEFEFDKTNYCKDKHGKKCSEQNKHKTTNKR